MLLLRVSRSQYVKNNNLEELYQSAYKTFHSTETALLIVQNDILMALDNKNSVILLLPDLSADFDTIDHEILLSRLSCRFGIVDKAQEWFKSYLTNRTFTVNVNVSGSESSIHTRAARWDPILFSLYISPLGDLLKRHGMNYHLYADDTQLYITFKSSDNSECDAAIAKIETCIREVDDWMTWNKLKLNGNKTELLVLTARNRPQPPLDSILLCDEVIRPSSLVRNLGILFDSSKYLTDRV